MFIFNLNFYLIKSDLFVRCIFDYQFLYNVYRSIYYYNLYNYFKKENSIILMYIKLNYNIY